MAAAILLLSVGATSSSPPAVSAPSLLDALGIQAEVHPTPLHRGRRRLQILTRENTKPLRLHLDFGSLYRETAVPYTTCFQEGAWYRRGFPGPEPPGGPTGVATCPRDSTEWSVAAEQGCWGRCTEADLVTPGGREVIEHVATVIAAEVSQLLAVERVSGNLEKGYTVESLCLSDCQTTAFAAVDEAYCSEGVEADAVLSITKPPGFEGVAGSGSACATEARGRPLWRAP
ncbi:hypothetical protein EMIHUDRAFT_217452 [Emiliania huxleyi CCMP1516]|uniref:Uncharacterized protein n=2 Tax=Emiliania huxleyi TaxID=2903 RepID=A0A0D3IAP9_EMIH1|nr:hypothetical protein EMIHUDRAFT_217452 [Emiliania huxleyi CCMP1516]EOD08334.1 hypothetical protein EMIHUDRAFT_217452 [Emiliania huxleyi CCMP1516]|eukprot:XP_005760763.1 hypothetical protein EMIHUDRAFT_217452 [Emiliania huxleyi CCMP1516]